MNNLMNGKVCVVTGATSGIGAETARQLAAHGARVIVVGRDAAKCAATVAAIRQSTGNAAVEFLRADLSSQKEIRLLAEQIKQKCARLDVLVNNAGGVYMARAQTVDGIERTFALNHLNYFLLTNLLLDLLQASAPARIISVSSGLHQQGTIEFDNLQGEKNYHGLAAYNNSKLANVLFTYELARRLDSTGVTVNALHPGVVKTNLFTNNGWFLKHIGRRLFDLFSISAEQGAATSVYLASSPDVANVTGKYFVASKAVSSSATSYDLELQRRLWQVSAAMVGLTHSEQIGK